MRPDLPGAGSRRGVISAGIFLCILVTGVTIGLMVELRQRTIAGSQRELLRFGTLVTEVAERALQAIDLAERDVLEDMRQKGVDSPAALAIYAQPEAMHDQLKKRITGLPQSEALSIVDADGAVLSFSAMWPSTGVSFAQRPYFERAKAAGSPDMFLSLVMPQFGDDKPALFIVHRVTTTDGRFLGVISGRVHGAYFQDLYKSVMPEGASTIALSLSDGTLALRYPPAPEFVGRAFAWLVMPPGRVEPMVFENVSPIDHLGRYVSMTALSNYPATIAVAVQKQTVLAPWRTEATLLGFGAGLLDLAIVGGIVLMLRQRRIERGALAATQLEADAKSRHERDRSIREGQVATDRAATLSNLASTFESKIGQVSRAVAKAAGYVQDGANNVTDLAGNASSRTRDAAAAAAAAAVTVTAMATATKALTGSIEQVARQSIQGAKLVSTAARAAHDADATVATLTASAETIGQIVDTISAIAQQTNLLALNATIEAARAGDTGRGFAVVAGEVKNLAKAVSDATTDIKQQIEGMQAATMQTAMAMQEIRKFVTEINAISVETTRAMEHQRTTTLQIAGTMVGAADDARALSVHVSDASLATAQTGTTAVSMKIVAHDLADQAAALQSASKQFLEQVHAA